MFMLPYSRLGLVIMHYNIITNDMRYDSYNLSFVSSLFPEQEKHTYINTHLYIDQWYMQ